MTFRDNELLRENRDLRRQIIALNVQLSSARHLTTRLQERQRMLGFYWMLASGCFVGTFLVTWWLAP